MEYTEPGDVHSPKKNWTLIAVMDEGKARTSALAIGRWDGEIRLAMRWNGHAGNPVGDPQSRGLATYYLLDPKYNEAILTSGLLSAEKLTLARSFIPAT